MSNYDVLSAYDLLTEGIIVYKVEDDKAKTIYANQVALDILGFEDIDSFILYTHGDYLKMLQKEDYVGIHDMMIAAKKNFISTAHQKYLISFFSTVVHIIILKITNIKIKNRITLICKLRVTYKFLTKFHKLSHIKKTS